MVPKSESTQMNSISIKSPKVWQKVGLPNGDSVVLSNGYRNGELWTLLDANHNVYRLNSQGEVVWQVQRDDSNHSPDWWDRMHRSAREDGHDGAREPFTEIQLNYADGTNNFDPVTHRIRNPSEWRPGCKILLVGSAYQQYVLDPETGIAKNVTDWPVRPW